MFEVKRPSQRAETVWFSGARPRCRTLSELRILESKGAGDPIKNGHPRAPCSGGVVHRKILQPL
jgi:hypothetical protein